MCGIFGIHQTNDKSMIHIDTSLVKSKLNRRGPDGWGEYHDRQVVLCHSRLSIIDLVGGKQPMFNEDKSIVIVFNGEIFNYQEIKKSLINAGHYIISNCDTEIIIHAYEEWGVSCLDRFRGMFAFAVWDNRLKQLFIARDRVGIKPLYYTIAGDKLYFASELKAILCFNQIERTIDNNALSMYLSLSYIPAPLTIYKNIYKLLPGHFLIADNDCVKIKKYWDVVFVPDYTKKESDFIDNLSELFEESIKLRTISDVPIGAFLSGGVDSGLVVSQMSKLVSEPINTFCMGFGGNVGAYIDERNYARTISHKYKTNHKEYEVNPNVNDIISDIVTSFDEPFADHSTIPTYYLCKLTSENVKVALSGLGGDELFGGYERYLGFKFSQIYNVMKGHFVDDILNKLISIIPERSNGLNTINHLKRFIRYSSLSPDKRYFGYLLNYSNMHALVNDGEQINIGLDYCMQYISDLYNSDNAKQPLDKILYTDIKSYLPEDVLACTDRISMWHSLEVRVPFLDHKLIEFCATIPVKYKIRYTQKKYLLKKYAEKYLTSDIISHKKQGFVGPMASWMRNELKEYTREVLSRSELLKHGIFNADAVTDIIDEHINYKNNNEKIIWTLIVFQNWYNQYMINK